MSAIDDPVDVAACLATGDRRGRAARLSRSLALALLGLALVAVPASTAWATPDSTVVKRIYIANDDHTDYFWTATDLDYRGAFQRMIDFYLNQADATIGNPPDARGRFNLDGSLWAWEYEHNRPASDFQRLMDHVNNGTISLPLQTCVMLYGAMPAEAVLRNMYYAGRLERRFGLRFPLVAAMEDQTMPGGVASLWAGSGAKYSWKGICNCATHTNAANRPREIYNFTGPDGQSVCMKWNTWNGAGSIGGYGENHNSVSGAVDYVDNDPAFQSRWAWPVSAAFGYGADNFETETNTFVDASQSLSNPSRRVIVSNETDFFADFLATYPNQIPSFSGSFGNEWDLYTASMGEVTADFKRHVEKLRTAEALATIATLYDPKFMNGRATLRDSAFLACGLYYEHDWTADGNVPRSVRAQFQRDQLRNLTRYVDALQNDGLAALAGLVYQSGGTERHLVFNPLSWTRTDFADIAVQQSWPVSVFDLSTGQEVRCEQVVVNGQNRVRILASDVPSVGYKVYEVRPGAGTTFTPSATVQLPWIDNGLYRVTLGSRGNITSLIDLKDGGRELVDGGGSIHDLGIGSGAVTLEHAGPVSTTLRVVASGTPDHETRVTLYSGIDRIDVEGLVTENFSGTMEYSSQFNLPGASIRHEEVGEIARVARAAQGGDYADQNTRTDYLSFNHFVDLSTPARGVTVSNWDSPFFAAGFSSTTVLDTTPRIRAVVGMQVDGAALGIMSQGGDSHFLDRFALMTHGAYDPAQSMCMSLEHQNPLVEARITSVGSAPYAAEGHSFFDIDSKEVLLWALKPAEEGIAQGAIVRLWNVANAPRSCSFLLPGAGIRSARRVTHIETDIGPQSMDGQMVVAQLGRQQMGTYRLMPQSTPLDVPPSAETAVRLAVRPNPARLGIATSITYSLPAAARVRITVHDVAGQLVATLVDGMQPAGDHFAQWNASRGSAAAPPGIYFVKLEAAGSVRTAKVVRLR